MQTLFIKANVVKNAPQEPMCKALVKGKTLMAPYLPSEGRAMSPYSEGGALFALGLIHANHGHDIREFLHDSLRASQSEVGFTPLILRC